MEGPRHYFKIDAFPDGYDFSGLSTNRVEAYRAQIDATPETVGLAPWTLLFLMEEASEAMRDGDWTWAAQCAAAISHYAADLHMPFHCTLDHNGIGTDQSGIHWRIETDVVGAHFDPAELRPSTAVYLDDPFRAILQWAAAAYAEVPTLRRADAEAARDAGGAESAAYRQRAWEIAGPTLVRQMSASAANVASLWYTAWIDAGKPPIPSAIPELPTHSVFSGVDIGRAAPPPEPRSSAPRRNPLDYAPWAAAAAFAIVALASVRRHRHDGAPPRK
jgi:hypothetical protein